MSRPRRRGNGEEALRRSAAFLGPATERWHALLEDHQRKRKVWNAVIQQTARASAMADRAVYQDAQALKLPPEECTLIFEIRAVANNQQPKANSCFFSLLLPALPAFCPR